MALCTKCVTCPTLDLHSLAAPRTRHDLQGRQPRVLLVPVGVRRPLRRRPYLGARRRDSSYTFADESLGDGAADAIAGAGDERNFASWVERIVQGTHLGHTKGLTNWKQMVRSALGCKLNNGTILTQTLVFRNDDAATPTDG